MGKGNMLTYPTAPNAWRGGIMFLTVVAEELPEVKSSGSADHHLLLPFVSLGQSHTYRIVPQCVGSAADWQVAYYVAYNVSDKRNDFAISPDKLDYFCDNLTMHFIAARNWYAFNPAQYQIQSGRVGYLAAQGHLRAAFSALGKAWLEALQDPMWWMLAVTSTASVLVGGGAVGSARAMQRLQQTEMNLLNANVQRSATVLSRPQIFRHTLTADVKATSFARIEQEGMLRLSTGAKAHYGEGVYAWGAQQQRIGTFVDIEVAAGTAVETLEVNGQTFYRLVPASGNTLPVKVVGTNMSAEEAAMGRQLLKD